MKRLAKLVLTTFLTVTPVGVNGCCDGSQDRPDYSQINPNKQITVWRENNTQCTEFGDFPPYDSLDYVVEMYRETKTSDWTEGELILPGDPRFPEYEAEYNSLKGIEQNE